MNKSILFLFFAFNYIIIYPQSKKYLDKESIKSMCGCFEVKFEFAEKFRDELHFIYSTLEHI